MKKISIQMTKMKYRDVDVFILKLHRFKYIAWCNLGEPKKYAFGFGRTKRGALWKLGHYVTPPKAS